MIPFRPTIDRVWEAMYELRLDFRGENGYEVVMHDQTEWDLLVDLRPGFGEFALDRQGPVLKIFGIPVRVDRTVRPGWIHLRHEVVK